MRRLYILIFLSLTACFNEEKIDSGQPFSFIRYYNGGGNDEAIAIKETSDHGYIILANTTRDGLSKIKLIKTDKEGNAEWIKTYPESPVANVNYTGYGIDLLPKKGGFVIVGEYKESQNSKLLILTVNYDGVQNKIAAIQDKVVAGQLQGKAVVVKMNADSVVQGFYILSKIINDNTNDMALGEFKVDLSVKWIRNYGAGEADLTNKLYVNSASSDTSFVWGGSVIRGEFSDIRLVKSKPDRQNTDYDLPIGNPVSNESGNDIFRFGLGYAIVGNSDEFSASSDQEIIFKVVDPTGVQISSANYPIKVNANGEVVTDGEPVPGDKVGNAIATTQDGGLLLVGTVPSNTALRFGKGGDDLYLIKISLMGDVIWQKNIGSRNDEQGVAALQSSDGGYIILATSTFAGLRTVMLLKTDKNGEIE